MHETERMLAGLQAAGLSPEYTLGGCLSMPLVHGCIAAAVPDKIDGIARHGPAAGCWGVLQASAHGHTAAIKHYLLSNTVVHIGMMFDCHERYQNASPIPTIGQARCMHGAVWGGLGRVP